MQIQKTLILVLPMLLGGCARGQSVSEGPAPDAQSQQPRTPAAAATVKTQGPMIGKCPVFPADNIWNTRVDRFPVDPHSPTYIQTIGADKPLHPDFGSDPKSGIPYNVVSGNLRKVPIKVDGAESETGPVPIPPNPALEGGGEGDSHLLIVDTDDCRLYELFAVKQERGEWQAYSAAHYDLRSNALRPDGWTSADAAGLSILAGLVRYEEVAAGEIRHAIRFTAPKTRRGYVWPARHFASRNDDLAMPPMGLRLRLRADFDISGFSKEAQVILRALKAYGMILADNGGPFFITGVPNANWNPNALTAELRKVVGSNFEVVDTLGAMRGPNSGAAVEPSATATASRGPSIGKCPVFPADSIWNTPVNKLPLDPHSSTYIQSIGADKTLHADFGRDPKSGIPFNVVSGNPRKVAVHAGGESDVTPAPIPANPALEGGEDAHLLVVDTDDCRLYELFAVKPETGGSWHAYSSAYYDLRSNTLRPDGWTSADAAGLPILAGLARYEEVAAGEIRHALRFTAPKTRRSYVWPARHYASKSDDPALPPMGLRVRLRADFDISGFSQQVQVILRALKTYGMILSDNGGPWFVTGAPNANWDDGNRIAEEMRRIPGSNFEVVDASTLMRTSDSGAALDQAPAAAAPGGPSIANCPVLPADNIWNTPIDRLPADQHSEILIKSIGLDKPLHPDFGNEPTAGIPYNVLSGNPPKVKVKVAPDENDIGPMPFPQKPVLEGGEDDHMLVIDPSECRLYELFVAKPAPGGGWQAYAAAYFDLRSNALRPDTWTSSDAAGLPIFPGLVRYDEVAAGEIRHAIRFSAPKTRRTYVWPARHYASRSDDPALPPMGLRLRLRANFDISGFSAQTQVILRALKKYGLMLSDNGSPWFITGAPDPRWEINRMVEEMRKVKGADFEVVDTSPLMQGPNSGAALKP
jgi:hypothetical protein